MKNIALSFFYSLLCFLTISTAHGAPTVYCFKKIIDGDGSVLSAREISVENGRIIEVGNRLKGERVDLTHLIALPGLIDAHTHITYGLDGPSKGNGWAELGQVNEDRRLAIAHENGLKTLQTGVTTIRDLNAINRVDFELREQINKGALIGPRIFTSGNAIHPSINPPQDGRSATSTEFVKEATQDRIDAGADWIKIFATTGSADDLTSTAYYPPEAIIASAKIAHDNGKRITIHSYGPEAVDAGIAAGVDSIDHPVSLSDRQIAAMREANIIYIPTIDHNRYYKDHADEYGYDETVQKNLEDFVAKNTKTLTRAHQGGVMIAMGSDAVMSGFGDNSCELKAFSKAGLTPEEAIQTATINGARLLGMEEQLGRIKKNYLADIIGVSADPLADIDHLINTVEWVMTDGKIVVAADPNASPIGRPDCGSQ